MTCCVFGPGLVGSFLGAAAASAFAIPGPSGSVRAHRILLNGQEIAWQPRLVQLHDEQVARQPVLIASRVHETPWDQLPLDARAAQNGLGQPRAVVTCFFAIDRRSDGVICATGPAPRVVVGAADGRWAAVFSSWRAHGLQVDICDDPRPAQWEKTVLNATVGPLCLATGLSMGSIWADARWRSLVLAATSEGETISRASGVACPAGMLARAERFFSQVGNHRPSLLDDPGELPWVLGFLLEAAEDLRLPAPALREIVGLVASRHGTPLAAPS